MEQPSQKPCDKCHNTTLTVLAMFIAMVGFCAYLLALHGK